MPRAERRIVVLLVVVAAGATTALLAARHSGTPPSVPTQSSWRELVSPQPNVSVGDRVIVVLRAPSLAQRVAAAGGRVSVERERAWTKAVQSTQRILLARLAVRGVAVHTELSFTRVLDGFSAELPVSAVPLVERDPGVAGVYPVRVAYPASLSVRPLVAGAPPGIHALASAGIDGRGVTVALLDAAVDRKVPSLGGRLLPGIDLVGGASSETEAHGTEMAGVIARVAPGAAILPIHVATPSARSDLLIAGLERAVDPNGDGDAHDAARIALVALAEPFAGFPDGPESLAVAGARALDVLVVAPVGNDGPAGASYGDVAAPGGAPDALTVGALDTRVREPVAHVAIRSGLDTLLDASVPLADAAVPTHSLSLQLAVPLGRRLTQFFTPSGGSLVAGRAALVSGGSSPVAAAEAAAEAGASAVLLYGDGATLPAGGFGRDVPVPVVSIAPRIAHAALARVAAGMTVGVTLGAVSEVPNVGEGRVAAFSSRGLSFGGDVKPDVVAPGVDIATVDAAGPVTVDGSSAAAAWVSAEAAVLAQARPSLHAEALAGLLVGTADALRHDAVASQGAGAVDVGAAAAGEIAASPPTVSLGPEKTAELTLRNLSSHAVRVRLGVRTQHEGAASVAISIRPSLLVLVPGTHRRVRLRVTVASAPVGTAAADGAVVATVAGGGAIRVPWVVAFDDRPAALIRRASLSPHTFRASDRRPALLRLELGAVPGSGGRIQVRPVSRLDVELVAAGGRRLGLLDRIRDVLPGRYTFGLTGRGSNGRRLPPGRYAVEVVAHPVEGGRPSRRKLGFTLR
jgi:subtilase family protein